MFSISCRRLSYLLQINTDPDNATRFWTYDDDGNMLTETDPLNATTTYTYNANGQILTKTDPDSNITAYNYDTDGNLISETDPAGNTTAFEYDALNRLINVTDALTHETTYTYDEVGNQLTQTDANLHTTSFEYDALGRMIKQTLPLGQSEFFTYDANGNQLTHTDFKGNTTTFDYDENNRLIQKTFQDNSEETYAYTATGRQDTVIDSRGLTVSLYDSGDRLTQVTHPDGSSIAYEYDSMGNRTAVVIGTARTEYTYDDVNRLEIVTDPDDGVTTYTYDANGNIESVTYPNSTVAEYTYDSQNRLTKLFNRKANGDTISCYTYSLGPAGNRTQVIEHTGRTVSYVYDDTYKLTEETIDDPDFGIRSINYTYDDVGNRLTKTDNGTNTTYTYDNNDRLLTENDITYIYDNNGNTLTKTSPTENVTYRYDYQNRLIEVDDGLSVVEYAYDTDGMRVQKTVDGNVTNFLLDKNRDYAQVLQEYDNSGVVIVDYIYGDDLISQKRSSLTSYYHYDGQLSTRQLTDVSANITDGYTYDAFGILINMFGATENNYLYTGEQYDPNVGFYYLRARYYNASIGRFLTMDTFPGMQFEPMSLHKYLYCDNSPLNQFDPSGNFTHLLNVAITTIAISTILCSISYVIYTDILNKSKFPVTWHGTLILMVYGNVLGTGVGYINIKSDNYFGRYGEGKYFLLLFGLTLSPWIKTLTIASLVIKSPGLFGPNSKLLAGPFSFASATFILKVAGPGWLGVLMGIAKGYALFSFSNLTDEKNWTYGRDFGIDIMGGWTYLIP